MRNKALITGGGGFIGSHLADKLLSLNWQVQVTDILAADEAVNLNAAMLHPLFTYVQGDITNPDFVNNIINDELDYVFHFAAVVGVPKYLENALNVVNVNVIGAKNVADATARHGVKLVFASTSEIYGNNPNVPWKEDDNRVLGSTVVERWSYSSSKAVAEHYLLAMHRLQKTPLCIIRYFNVYGPRQCPIFVVSRSMRNALTGRQPVLHDGGSQTRCFTYVADAINATLRIAESEKAVGQVYNVGSTFEYAMRQVVELVNEKCGFNGGIDHVNTLEKYGDKYQDIDRRIPNVSKIKCELNWNATTTFEEGLTKTIAWAKENDWWLKG